jgi:hypothetical protein
MFAPIASDLFYATLFHVIAKSQKNNGGSIIKYLLRILTYNEQTVNGLCHIQLVRFVATDFVTTVALDTNTNI